MTVQLEGSTRAAAVLKIYRDQARRPGDTLSSHELRAAWAQTGLRRQDLDIAARELTEHGLLKQIGPADDPRYELTGEGAELLAHPNGDVLTRVVDWWFLELARRRPRDAAPEADAPHRRADDSAAH